MSNQMRFVCRCLHVKDWPETHQSLWKKIVENMDIFGPLLLASFYRETTIVDRRKGYGVWISWLIYRGLLDPNRPPSAYVTRENVSAYYQELSATKASITVFSRLLELYCVIKCMHPDGDWQWLLRAVNKSRRIMKPKKNKRKRLQPANKIRALGFTLMQNAKIKPDLSLYKRAIIFRDGLIIALLIHRPLRLKNFSAMILDRSLVKEKNKWTIFYMSDETKQKRDFEADFPQDLYLALEEYLKIYRPYLLSLSKNNHGTLDQKALNSLWISNEGKTLNPGALSVAVKKRTKIAFGVDMSPHLFRDASVTTLMRQSPESTLLAKSILGHASIEMTNKYYNNANMIAASTRYANLIEEIDIH